MKENYKKIRNMCQKNNITSGKLTDEYIFTLNCVDYFYFNRNIGEMDIIEGFVDGTGDGGIDYILNKEDVMYLIQGKSSSNLSIEDIKGAFYKILETINNFDKNKYDKYSGQLKQVFLNRFDDLSDDKNIEIVLFTNTILTDYMKEEFFKYKNEVLSDYKISLYDGEDIEKRELMSIQGDTQIFEDKIELWDIKNYLEYNGSVIVNIKASSLKRLYSKYSQKGLFSYNLREHISQKNVDNGIDETIRNDSDNFWFYNNGITIGCMDYDIDGDNIKIHNFSIINGAQTTTKIGESKAIDIYNDFALVCKVVKANDSLENSSNFISKISEASNSQKPIRPRDLKSNATEQKRLSTGSSQNAYPLAIEIKRGVVPSNFKSVNNKWQRVTNEYIGQLILACLLQKPGTARSGKASIFSSDKIYNQVYKRKHDYDTLYDLARIAHIFEDEFKPKYLIENNDIEKIGIMQNGKFTILSVIFYLYKKKYCDVNKYSDEKLNIDNISGKLTLGYDKDDYENKLYSLFRIIILRLSELFNSKKSDLGLTSYSNFFKTDLMYKDIILRYVDEMMKEDFYSRPINEYMSIFDNKENQTL